MKIHYMKLATRNIIRHKQSVFVNALCLTLGFAVFMLLMRYVNYEKSWDKENPNYERIYRVNKIVKFQNSEREYERNHYPLAAALKMDLPEIEESAIVRPCSHYLSVDANKVVFEDGYLASNSILSIFPYKILDGDKNSMLSKPYSMVVSKTLANKLYPDQNPLGKTVLGGSKEVYTITGVIDDVPENRIIRPNYFISAITEELRKNLTDNWTNRSDYWVYVLLKENTQASVVNPKINQVFWKHKDKTLESIFLQPLEKLHLEATRSSDLKYVPLYYSILAFLTLLLACINYMNLSNVSALNRSKEVGILKVSGSSRLNLILQYLGEGAILSFLALLAAFALFIIFLPVFNKIVDRSIMVGFFHNASFYILLIVIALIVGLLSNIYPALILSSYNPVKVLKSGVNVIRNGKSAGRKTLLVFQFFIASAIMSSSFWVYNQVNFMHNKSLGYNTDKIIYCQMPNSGATIHFDDVRNQLLSNSSISNVCYSRNSPMHSTWTEQVFGEKGNPDTEILSEYNIVSHDFIDTYQMKIVDGRNFSRDFESDQSACVINETCAQAMGWNNPLDKELIVWDKAYKIIGVVRDFHNTSVHDRIKPYFMVLSDGNLSSNFDLAIKTTGTNRQQTVQFINSTLMSIFNNVLFMVDDFNDSIDDEGIRVWKSVKKTFLFFSFLSMAIALFGLFGLVSYSAKKRTKEVGIRKVQGSTIYQIFVIINKEYFVLLTIAIVLGLPFLSLFSDYTPGAYKYQAQLSDYLLVVLAIYGVALLTSGWQSWRAATRNPVEALRYE